MESDLNLWFKEKIIDQSEQELMISLFEAANKGHLCLKTDKNPVSNLPVIKWGENLYFERFWKLENQVVTLFKNLVREKPAIPLMPAHLNHLHLESEQKEAIQLGLSSRLTFITGGPGTGKTFTAGQLIKEALNQVPTMNVAICAPTGRAVGQLSASISRHLPSKAFKAATLHRLLEIWQEDFDILPYDLILADEASMIDIEMMIRLFAALKPGARLILMGDPFQLPPVEAGSIFADLTPYAPHVHLKKCLRTELKEIVEFAELVRQQDAEGALKYLKQHQSPIVWKESDIYDFNIAEKPILTPLRKGKCGSEAFNLRGLQENPVGPFPILITRNQEKLELYNGDLGILETLNPQPGDKAYFGKRVIPALFISGFDLAWALSIHKSQGSEFESIRAVFPEGSESFGVSALYTAITRAKRHVEIWAQEATLKTLIETPSRRYSGIKSYF